MHQQSETQTPRSPRIVLLTGGCGFIGSNLAHWLVDKTEIEKVVVLDCLSDGSDVRNLECSPHYGSRLILEVGEFGNYPLVIDLLQKYRIDCVLHLGGETHVDRSYKDPIKCAEINVLQSIALLEACKDYGKLSVFFHMSTDEVYGDHNPEPCTESTLLNPTNPYAASKAATEQFVKAYHYSYQLPLVMMRSNNVYGPMQSDDKVLPRFVSLMLDHRPITLHGSGSQSRNWLYVTDVCEAFWAILTRGRIGETYNIGSENEVTIADLATCLHGALKKSGAVEDDLEFVHLPDRPHNDRYYRLDWGKITRELGWSPKVTFEDGIRETVRWYLENRRHS